MAFLVCFLFILRANHEENMKIVRATLETLTQCVLLPGVELHFDDVMSYFKNEMGSPLKERVRKINRSLNRKPSRRI
jgi:hypothetical protein